MGVLNGDSSDAIKDLTKALQHNTFASLAAAKELYRYRQFDEANKVPADWNAYSVILPSNTAAINVFPRNPKRAGFVLGNTGSAVIYYQSRYFDINEILALETGQGSGVIQVGSLSTNQTANLATSGPLYVATGTGSSTLSVNELLYRETTRERETGEAGSHWEPTDALGNMLEAFVKELV